MQISETENKKAIEKIRFLERINTMGRCLAGLTYIKDRGGTSLELRHMKRTREEPQSTPQLARTSTTNPHPACTRYLVRKTFLLCIPGWLIT